MLLTALQRGFEAARAVQANNSAGALQQKAIIFTESRRTQEYLFNLLQKTDFAGKVVLFNGTNTDLQSQSIYRAWMKQHAGTDRITGSPTADKRAALVEYFRDDASIMIATEAAAEGINLQFCNLVVNYDMPWNPQRIEQRIGRCHRYGQKYDVVVVNFLNKANAADVRVYQLLAEKFKLFDGVSVPVTKSLAQLSPEWTLRNESSASTNNAGLRSRSSFSSISSNKSLKRK